MKKLLLFVFLISSFFGCKDSAKTSETTPEKDTAEVAEDLNMDPVTKTAHMIAEAHGIDNWEDISELKFTFNVDRGESHFERSWTWWVKDKIVEMSTDGNSVRYLQTEVNDMHKAADPEFVNDSFWLLAPFHLVWDSGTTLRESKMKRAPISGDTLSMLTLTYGDIGGYTPGDAYDFYFGSDYLIKEWVFRQGNDSVPSMTTTWEDYEDVGGLKIGKMHTDSTQRFQIYFSDVSVKK